MLVPIFFHRALEPKPLTGNWTMNMSFFDLIPLLREQRQTLLVNVQQPVVSSCISHWMTRLKRYAAILCKIWSFIFASYVLNINLRSLPLVHFRFCRLCIIEKLYLSLLLCCSLLFVYLVLYCVTLIISNNLLNHSNMAEGRILFLKTCHYPLVDPLCSYKNNLSE